MPMKLGPIKPTDLVLEIGSGDRPNPRSDVLVDRFIDDNTERGGDLRIDRPLIVADAQALPFKDKSFDYVVCYHILEHMDEPAQFLSEITRVGKRGHIQSPSEIAERLFHWPFHRWYVNAVGGKLILHELDGEETFGDLFDYLFAHNRQFAAFSRSLPELFYVDYEWEDTIEFEIRAASPLNLRDPRTLRRLTRPDSAGLRAILRTLASYVRDFVPQPMLAAAKQYARRRRGTTRQFNVDALLACPVCHATLHRGVSDLTCSGCGRRYPVIRGLPHLVLDEALDSSPLQAS